MLSFNTHNKARKGTQAPYLGTPQQLQRRTGQRGGGGAPRCVLREGGQGGQHPAQQQHVTAQQVQARARHVHLGGGGRQHQAQPIIV